MQYDRKTSESKRAKRRWEKGKRAEKVEMFFLSESRKRKSQNWNCSISYFLNAHRFMFFSFPHCGTLRGGYWSQAPDSGLWSRCLSAPDVSCVTCVAERLETQREAFRAAGVGSSDSGRFGRWLDCVFCFCYFCFPQMISVKAYILCYYHRIWKWRKLNYTTNNFIFSSNKYPFIIENWDVLFHPVWYVSLLFNCSITAIVLNHNTARLIEIHHCVENITFKDI